MKKRRFFPHYTITCVLFICFFSMNIHTYIPMYVCSYILNLISIDINLFLFGSILILIRLGHSYIFSFLNFKTEFHRRDYQLYWACTCMISAFSLPTYFPIIDRQFWKCWFFVLNCTWILCCCKPGFWFCLATITVKLDAQIFLVIWIE